MAAEKSLVTTGPPAEIRLKADSETIMANKNDLAYIEVRLLDDKGRLVMDDDRMIHFKVSGSANLQGVGNGNPTDMKSLQADSCMTYLGRCIAILRPVGRVGDLTVTAKSKSLESDGIDVMIK